MSGTPIGLPTDELIPELVGMYNQLLDKFCMVKLGVPVEETIHVESKMEVKQKLAYYKLVDQLVLYMMAILRDQTRDISFWPELFAEAPLHKNPFVN